MLLPGIVQLLARCGLAIGDIGAYAVTVGPGSFTGLRVGISTVQGLALAAGRPCLGLNALDVLASRIVGEAERLVAVMDAYRDEVYSATYDAAGQPLDAPAVGPLAELLGRIPTGSAFAGDGARKHATAIRAGLAEARFPERPPELAPALAGLAAPALAAGRGVAAAELRPFYLREAAVRPSTR